MDLNLCWSFFFKWVIMSKFRIIIWMFFNAPSQHSRSLLTKGRNELLMCLSERCQIPSILRSLRERNVGSQKKVDERLIPNIVIVIIFLYGLGICLLSQHQNTLLMLSLLHSAALGYSAIPTNTSLNTWTHKLVSKMLIFRPSLSCKNLNCGSNFIFWRL